MRETTQCTYSFLKLPSQKLSLKKLPLKKTASLYFSLMVAGFLNVIAFHAQASSEATTPFKTEVLTEQLSHPWGMTFLPNGELLVTERKGKLKRISIKSGDITEITGLPDITTGGQGGLLDIAIDPDFKTNNWLYFSYVASGNKGTNGTEVARAKLEGEQLTNIETIFKSTPKVKGRHHFGSRLTFAGNNTLFISLGERYSYKEEAQSVENHHGTIIRIHKDGSVPSDNPFLNTANAQPEIYSFGHRNVQGLAYDSKTKTLWSHEHGPRGGDELNIVKPGANYGWPVITYGIDYSGAIISELTHKEGLQQPVEKWVPSIAPSGLAIYNKNTFKQWQGDLFIGALSHRHLRRLKIENNKVVEQEELLKERKKRVRDVEVGPDGFIYVLTDESKGELLRLIPAE